MKLTEIVSVLRSARETVQLEVTSGPFEFGGVLVHEGALWHAEVPGTRGAAAWTLLTRVPVGYVHFRELVSPGSRTVEPRHQPKADTVDDETRRAVMRGRAEGRVAIGSPVVSPRSSVGTLSLPPASVPAAAGESSAGFSLQGLTPAERTQQEEYEGHFRVGTQAYLRHDFPTAKEAFEACLRLRPNDRRALHNLERLKSRT